MNVSMSLPEEDVEFLDAYAQDQGYASRSAVLRKAVQLLRAAELSDTYEDAWAEWATSGEASRWDAAAGEGVDACSR